MSIISRRRKCEIRPGSDHKPDRQQTLRFELIPLSPPLIYPQNCVVNNLLPPSPLKELALAEVVQDLGQIVIVGKI